MSAVARNGMFIMPWPIRPGVKSFDCWQIGDEVPLKRKAGNLGICKSGIERRTLVLSFRPSLWKRLVFKWKILIGLSSFMRMVKGSMYCIRLMTLRRGQLVLLSEGMEIPKELEEKKFNFARQKSTLAETIRGTFFVIKKEY